MMQPINRHLRKTVNNQNINERFEKLMMEVQQDASVQAFFKEHENEITEEMILRSTSKLYEFVKEKEKYELNAQNMLAPGYEPRLFLNYNYIDVTYVPTEALIKEQEQQTIKNRVRSVAMPKDIKNAILEDYDVNAGRTEAIKLSLSFINEYAKTPKTYHQGLYLYGQFGVGKTYLLGAVANDLAKRGYNSTVIHFPTFCVEMKQSIKDETVGPKLDVVKKAPVLMIDDIGADSMSSWIRDDILGVILQYRMQEDLPTFFSSNFDMEQLENEHLRYSQRGEDEPLKAKRIMERIRYLSKEVTLSGKNRRIQE